MKKYTVLSPDGFPLERDAEYKSKKEAKDAIVNFVKRFKKQGYYSMSDRTRLLLEDLPDYCEIIEL